MKNARAKLGMGLLLSALMLTTGCGDKAIQLTEEEEEVIVNYASHVVSKFNTRQPDGVVHVEVPKEDVNDEKETETETETEAQAESTEANTGQFPDESGGVAPETAEQPTEEAPQARQVTLTEGLGMADIEALVTSTELKASYIEKDYYAMDASAGKTYLIVHVVLKNIGNAEINCDMLAMAPQFAAEVNGMGAVPAETTILLNDLSTYQGVIPAGGSEELVLLFQVPSDTVTQVDSLTLDLAVNGENFVIPCM